MAEYIGIEIDDDQATIREDITDRIIAVIPNWLPVRGGLIYLLADGVAFVIAELYGILRLVTTAIFAVYLTKLAGIPAHAATPSTATTTWTSSTLSYTVDAGTIVGIDDGAGGLVAFEVTEDVSTVDGEASVEIISQDTGEFTAELSGDVVLLDSELAAELDGLTIVLDADTAGGTDGESLDDHIARGSERLQLSSDDVIRGDDAAILARQTTGVWRAMAVDNYDVATDDDAAEGKIALALQAEDGGAVSSPIKATVLADVQESTIVGLEVAIADPDPTAVDVRFDFIAHEGYDTADVKDRAEAAVEAFLASNLWGTLPFGDELIWRPQPTVYLYDVAQVILSVEGLDRIDTGTLEIREDGGSWGTADVVLGTKPWSIAEPGTVTATAVT